MSTTTDHRIETLGSVSLAVAEGSVQAFGRLYGRSAAFPNR